MKKLLKYYLLSIILLSDFVTYAQPGDNDTGGGLEGGDPAPAPINGKLILLAISGLFFVFYTYRKNRKTIY
ncbi:DUF1673 domain-containing protein [Flavobacterium sp. N1994]|uniref:DUF1673 domain-containing protein n=1 Tax=Flavobacterium sp. N1994 TaxID=2986827 RepID=UPI00222353F6|nr:DUF1673 domain-containing protein [Flavobacterium sp. N1994]